MKITVKLFSYFTKYLPPGSYKQAIDLTVEDGTTAGQALQNLNIPKDELLLALFNGVAHTVPDEWMTYELKENDVLAVLPKMNCGGKGGALRPVSST
ncbi:MAG: MoaD/ThiS family protein [Rhodospirillales bacterium]|nr:MoaD/ThiS family protein [Rhodospirillales bacterium]